MTAWLGWVSPPAAVCIVNTVILYFFARKFVFEFCLFTPVFVHKCSVCCYSWLVVWKLQYLGESKAVWAFGIILRVHFAELCLVHFYDISINSSMCRIWLNCIHCDTAYSSISLWWYRSFVDVYCVGFLVPLSVLCVSSRSAVLTDVFFTDDTCGVKFCSMFWDLGFFCVCESDVSWMFIHGNEKRVFPASFTVLKSPGI